MTSEYHDSIVNARAKLTPSGDLGGIPLLTTKLYRPPVTPDLEQRTRLIERLERNRQRPLTLISAPAGYGKTMLASMWLETSGSRSAWISLDEDDNDLVTFLSYLLAAIGEIHPDIELRTRSLMYAPSLPQAPALARYLLNDLDQIEEPFILALDDTHRIQEQAIYALLNELLHHPSSTLHLALIGRHDPPLQITSLRAHGQVTEIRSQDLRFTPQETAGLMRQMLDRKIDEAVAAEWTLETEGWVTALRLAALSLRHRGQTDNLRVAFLGDSRYLRDYLLAEVLGYLPPAKQAWILKTATLDRFCAPLCEAVCQADTDPADLTGEKFIDRLEQENLFLIPLDDRGEWFRFHHLFQQHLQDMLQTQLSSEEIAALRARASHWFAENNMLDEALKYALAAGDVRSAVHLVEQQRYQLMNTEQWHRLERWIKLLTDDAVAQDPALMITKAYIIFHRGRDTDMISSLRRAEQLFANLTPGTEEFGTLQSEIDVMNALLTVMAGQPARSIDRIDLSLERLPVQALQIRSLALAAKAVSLQILGDLKGGVDVIRNALAETAWPEELQAKFMDYLCILFFQEGDLSEVLASARTCVGISEKIRASMTLSWCRYHLGIVHYLRNEFMQAELVLQAFLKDRATTAPNYLAHGCFALALIYQAQDRVDDADQVIKLLGDHLRETKDILALAFFEAMLVEVALRRGKLAQARQLSNRVDFNIRPPMWFFYVPQLTPIKLLLAEGNPESLEEARARLDALDDAMRVINRKNVLIDVLALKALVRHALGDEPAALEDLVQALIVGEPGGFIRTFVDLGAPMEFLLLRLKEQETDIEYADYIEQILEAFPQDQSSEASATHEILTDREYEVLSFLAKRLSNREIAEKLVISLPTVKSHTLNIYSKLGVNKRNQAVEKAVELGILPED